MFISGDRVHIISGPLPSLFNIHAVPTVEVELSSLSSEEATRELDRICDAFKYDIPIVPESDCLKQDSRYRLFESLFLLHKKVLDGSSLDSAARGILIFTGYVIAIETDLFSNIGMPKGADWLQCVSAVEDVFSSKKINRSDLQDVLSEVFLIINTKRHHIKSSYERVSILAPLYYNTVKKLFL